MSSRVRAECSGLYGAVVNGNPICRDCPNVTWLRAGKTPFSLVCNREDETMMSLKERFNGGHSE